VRDLLGADPKARLQLKEHPDKGVYVQDLLEEVVNDVDAINEVMARGEKNRTVGATLMNAGSSRSHSIFTVSFYFYFFSILFSMLALFLSLFIFSLPDNPV
jgi:kinesin family member 17